MPDTEQLAAFLDGYLSRLRDSAKGPPSDRHITPNLPRQVTDKLYSVIERSLGTGGRIQDALRAAARNWPPPSVAWARELCPVALLIADLVDQGWKVWLDEKALAVRLTAPGLQSTGETAEEAKDRLRRAHQVGRNRQLEEPSVGRFLRRMERRTARTGVKASVLDLIDSGRELAAELRAAAALDDATALEALRGLVEPEVVACDEEARCPETGLLLSEVWRYARHTWSLEYRSIPGRTLPLLIRNAARPRRPIIGIALLASPVIRTAPRDIWMGWNVRGFLTRIRDGAWPPKAALEALRARVEDSIGEIRWDDLATAEEISWPTERAVFRLAQDGAGAAAEHASKLRKLFAGEGQDGEPTSPQRSPEGEDQDWMARSEEPLFRRKRAETLSELLAAKRAFRQVDWSMNGGEIIRALLTDPAGERAVSTALREWRKAGLASRVADLSVCGALAPYGPLLGGKLVALLMASAEVQEIYRARYDGRVSDISSKVAGRPICRPAELRVLTTTSLYGMASSQYNRLRLRAQQHPALGTDVEWEERDATAGYGSVHLAGETVSALRDLGRATHKASRINSEFGEGASPRLRQIREGLDALGIQSDHVLHHDMPRLFYGCRLTPTAHEELVGLTAGAPGSAPSAAAIAAAWRARWLLGRVRRTKTLADMERLGPESVRADLMPATEEGQFLLPLPAAV